MLIVLNLVEPDDDGNPPVESKNSKLEDRKETPDYSRVTRLQVINIHGQIVDVEH